jgi:hypothetical protein
MDENETYRRMAPAKKMEIASSLHDFACSWVESSIRQQHPQFSDVQVKTEMLRRFVGDTARIL